MPTHFTRIRRETKQHKATTKLQHWEDCIEKVAIKLQVVHEFIRKPLSVHPFLKAENTLLSSSLMNDKKLWVGFCDRPVT